jgi:hypothetical protein
MAAKDAVVRKYVVRLSGEEREQPGALLRKGMIAISEAMRPFSMTWCEREISLAKTSAETERPN